VATVRRRFRATGLAPGQVADLIVADAGYHS
jgi:hypothetical protein